MRRVRSGRTGNSLRKGGERISSYRKADRQPNQARGEPQRCIVEADGCLNWESSERNNDGRSFLILVSKPKTKAPLPRGSSQTKLPDSGSGAVLLRTEFTNLANSTGLNVCLPGFSDWSQIGYASRLCFASFDPQLYFHPHALELATDASCVPIASNKRNGVPVGQGCRATNATERQRIAEEVDRKSVV